MVACSSSDPNVFTTSPSAGVRSPSGWEAGSWSRWTPSCSARSSTQAASRRQTRRTLRTLRCPFLSEANLTPPPPATPTVSHKCGWTAAAEASSTLALLFDFPSIRQVSVTLLWTPLCRQTPSTCFQCDGEVRKTIQGFMTESSHACN